MATTPNSASCQSRTLRLPRRLDVHTSSEYWRICLNRQRSIVFDASEVEFCDEAGLALLAQIRAEKERFQLANVPKPIEQLYSGVVRDWQPAPETKQQTPGFIVEVGRSTALALAHLSSSFAFLGECLVAIASQLLHPSRIRFKEIAAVSDEAGSRAVGIVCLIGFLMGVIIAFETALVAKIFGAVIFVVNGIGIAMTRELGPLMTAILFAGRSGSAFAAQLGTQKVNEELNALTTFGLNPISFLVVPRLLASVLVMPLLTVFAIFIGIIGGGVVMQVYDITMTQFYMQLVKSITLVDVIFGLVKAAIFGFVIALIGCQCGMNTGAGAAAVGVSTTESVVRSIVWIVVIDGVAALLSNQLGW